MKRIGAHVSASGGVENAPLNAMKIGANAFALFTKNQRQWASAPLTQTGADAFRANCRTAGIAPEYILPHDSYLINPCHPDPEKRRQSAEALRDEMARCAFLGLKYLNFHPGSTLDAIDVNTACKLCADSINAALEQVPAVTAVIENTAGQGSNIGHRFEHLAMIIEHVKDRNRVGICIDTCHTFAAGYDLRTPEDCAATFAEIDRVVGLKYLRAMHINDAKSEFSSHVDRHHSLRLGTLGDAVFEFVMNEPHCDDIPLILETIDEERWAKEIEWLRSLIR